VQKEEIWINRYLLTFEKMEPFLNVWGELEDVTRDVSNLMKRASSIHFRGLRHILNSIHPALTVQNLAHALVAIVESTKPFPSVNFEAQREQIQSSQRQQLTRKKTLGSLGSFDAEGGDGSEVDEEMKKLNRTRNVIEDETVLFRITQMLAFVPNSAVMRKLEAYIHEPTLKDPSQMDLFCLCGKALAQWVQAVYSVGYLFTAANNTTTSITSSTSTTSSTTSRNAKGAPQPHVDHHDWILKHVRGEEMVTVKDIVSTFSHWIDEVNAFSHIMHITKHQLVSMSYESLHLLVYKPKTTTHHTNFVQDYFTNPLKVKNTLTAKT